MEISLGKAKVKNIPATSQCIGRQWIDQYFTNLEAWSTRKSATRYRLSRSQTHQSQRAGEGFEDSLILRISLPSR